jgi:hypothetical protein
MVMTSNTAVRQTITTLTNDNPGPGAYLTHYEKILKKNPRAIIGSSKRSDLLPKDIMNNPGPTNYLPNIDAVKKTSANWTIKTAKRYETPDDTSRGRKNS